MAAGDKDPWDRIECVQGDITREEVDAIVNAANETLRGGAGVDGAIHRAAGPGLLQECIERHPDGCPTGEARVTAGHALPARFVVHTVGPVWRGGGRGEAERLAACHRNALRAAEELSLKTVAFPAISTGAYGYPLEEAAEVALTTIRDELAGKASRVERVRVVLFDGEMLEVFRRVGERLRGR